MAEETSHHEAPGLPEIRDEAADTPLWVPILGLVLLVVFALTVVLQATLGSSQQAGDVQSTSPTQQVPAEASAEGSNG